MAPSHDQSNQSLRLLLMGIAGPSYQGALQEGDVGEQIERCISWVKAEASEAASLIESCVPHGKPMLAQAQQRLSALESLQMLEQVVTQYFCTSERN